MIRISNIKIGAHKEQKKVLEQEICRMLHIKSMQGLSYHIVKKSIDARKKESIQCIYTVDIAGLKDEQKIVAKAKKDTITIAKEDRYVEPVHGETALQHRPVVIGAGPAGCRIAIGGAWLSAYLAGAWSRCRYPYQRCRAILADWCVKYCF